MGGYKWWGRWWAAQLVWIVPEFGFGIWIEVKRPLVDLHLLWLTISIGRHPAITDPRLNQAHSGRGFFNGAYPTDKVL